MHMRNVHIDQLKKLFIGTVEQFFTYPYIVDLATS
jgi:hypothetical protein